MKAIPKALTDIRKTRNLLEKALKLAGLVTEAFRTAGWDLAVVGGSAVEFYTEGDYMSGDVDFCRRTIKPIPLRTAQEIMSKLEATGGPRNWMVGGLFVDLLGLIENEALVPYTMIETPYGRISLIPIELVLVERVLTALYPRPNTEGRIVAAKLMAVCLRRAVAVDWKEVERLATLPSFKILKEIRKFRKEVAGELHLKA